MATSGLSKTPNDEKLNTNRVVPVGPSSNKGPTLLLPVIVSNVLLTVSRDCLSMTKTWILNKIKA